MKKQILQKRTGSNKARIAHTIGFESKSDDELLDLLDLAGDALENPTFNSVAKRALSILKERGYEIGDDYLQDPDCLACLYTSVMDALEYRPMGEKH